VGFIDWKKTRETPRQRKRGKAASPITVQGFIDAAAAKRGLLPEREKGPRSEGGKEKEARGKKKEKGDAPPGKKVLS